MNYDLEARVADYDRVVRWLRDHPHVPETIAAVYTSVLDRGGTLFFVGNGGSAADAQHLAAEYVGRFILSGRKPLRAHALTTDTSILTALANDFGAETMFSRQVAALVTDRDALIAHSTSGRSQNLVVAFRVVKTLYPSVPRIALLGARCSASPLAAAASLRIYVDAEGAPAIQMGQMMLQHLVAEVVDYWAMRRFGA
mgnify:CR=1 FL=1